MVANSPAAWDERAVAPSAWEAALWGSRESQRGRLERAVAYSGVRPGDSVLDFGCGAGALLEHLPVGVLYHGVDWSSEMRDRVEREYGPRVHRLSATLEPGLWNRTFAIGPFNLADGWGKQHTLDVLYRIWEYTRKVMVTSLHCGEAPGHITYRVEDVARWADSMGGSRYVLDRWKANDLILAVYK